MRTLRAIGITTLLAGFLFKVMHWPGADALAVSGGLIAAVGALAPLLRRQAPATAGAVLRPLMGVLLCTSALMNMLHLPGGDILFHGMVMVTIVFLLSDRARFDLPRWSDLRGLPLLASAGLLAATGTAFKVMHWPSANVQLIAALGCAMTWTVWYGLRPRRAVTAGA